MFGCFGKHECIFCSVSTENGFSIIYEDDTLVAFHDRSPGAGFHALVIPKDHVSTVKSLDKSHVPLLERMIGLANRLLKDNGYTDADQRLGFHVPPFNSINHIHLHVLGLPFKSRFREWKYTPGLWFAKADYVLARLRQGQSV
ncbi:HIT-like domain-containing protein [Phycomyces nitens]|nr:HIT-like domain-containing protein [Phycomyces nitens]